MIVRQSAEADLDTIRALIAAQDRPAVPVDRFDEYFASGAYRNDWIWVAEQAGAVVAAAVWWGKDGYSYPYSLDVLCAAPGIDEIPCWTELIRSAVTTFPADAGPEYHLFLPNGWRDRPEVAGEIEPRLEAAAKAGLSQLTERLRYEWTLADGLPARSTRLRFEPADDEAFVDVFRRVSEGSLDAATARDVARIGADDAARATLAGYSAMPGDRSWWRLAYDGDGELVGCGLPSTTSNGSVAAYLGVVPEQRGKGYGDDLLAEITHQLVELGAERIRSDTDLTNKPMAASFDRLGYRNHAVRIVASYPID